MTVSHLDHLKSDVAGWIAAASEHHDVIEPKPGTRMVLGPLDSPNTRESPPLEPETDPSVLVRDAVRPNPNPNRSPRALCLQLRRSGMPQGRDCTRRGTSLLPGLPPSPPPGMGRAPSPAGVGQTRRTSRQPKPRSSTRSWAASRSAAAAQPYPHPYPYPYPPTPFLSPYPPTPLPPYPCPLPY